MTAYEIASFRLSKSVGGDSASLSQRHRDVRRGYFRRVTEFIGLVPSGFHGRELPCIIAARRNQTEHRTSNGAPAATYGPLATPRDLG